MLETEIPIAEDSSGAIFIDRDPAHFRLILNFMRDGDVKLPESSDDVEEIQKEAQYYLLEDLVELCEQKIASLSSFSDWNCDTATLISIKNFDDKVRAFVECKKKGVIIFYYSKHPDQNNELVQVGLFSRLFREFGDHFDVYIEEYRDHSLAGVYASVYDTSARSVFAFASKTYFDDWATQMMQRTI